MYQSHHKTSINPLINTSLTFARTKFGNFSSVYSERVKTKSFQHKDQQEIPTGRFMFFSSEVFFSGDALLIFLSLVNSVYPGLAIHTGKQCRQ